VSTLKRKVEADSEKFDTIIYLKIKAKRPIDEVVKILEALKE